MFTSEIANHLAATAVRTLAKMNVFPDLEINRPCAVVLPSGSSAVSFGVYLGYTVPHGEHLSVSARICAEANMAIPTAMAGSTGKLYYSFDYLLMDMDMFSALRAQPQ